LTSDKLFIAQACMRAAASFRISSTSLSARRRAPFMCSRCVCVCMCVVWGVYVCVTPFGNNSDADHTAHAHTDTKKSLAQQVASAQGEIAPLLARAELGEVQLLEAKHGVGVIGKVEHGLIENKYCED
jgi:hypothetical protein